MDEVIQLVPTLPPPAEGVGSYALALAQALAERHGIESRFLIGDPAWKSGEELGFPAVPLSARTAVALGAALAPEGAAHHTILLHYANYGYQRRGCPRWLAAGLEHWLTSGRRRRLVTVFHEVHASGPPWRSSFWLRPVQRRIAATVAKASAATVTSLGLYARLLKRWVTAGTAVLPVFSTVGEPEQVPPWGERPARLVVFGGRGARAATYGPLAAQLELTCRTLGIEEVCDVGPSLASVPGRLGPAAVVRHGTLPADEVSALLLASRAGYVAYPAHLLPKSTIFAAYAAHGVLPVRGWPHARERPPEEVLPGLHFWEAKCDRGDFRSIAAAAHGWYRGHRLAVQADTFRELLLR